MKATESIFITPSKMNLFMKAHKKHGSWGKVPSSEDMSAAVDLSRRQSTATAGMKPSASR